MTSPMLYEPWYPGRDFNPFSPPLDNGAEKMANLKRRLNMREEPTYDKDFKTTEVRRVYANSLETRDVLEFDFQTWKDSLRVPPSRLFLRVSFHKPDKTKLPDTAATMGTNNAWLRDNFLTNYIKLVEFIVNGQTVEQRDYDHVARVVKTMTLPKDRENYDRLRSDWGIPHDAPINTTRTGEHVITDDSLKTLTPSTLPATVDTVNDKTVVAIREQEAYNKRYGSKLLGSKEHIFSTDILYPMNQEFKLLPFSTAFKIRIVLNDRNNCFTCASGMAPYIKIHEAWFEDWLIRCDSEFVDKVSKDIVSGEGKMNFPITRRVLNMHEIPQTNHMKINRAIIGDIPSRVYLFVAPSNHFLANNSTRNPYVYKFPFITRFTLKYGDKEWPRKGGVEILGVPDNVRDGDYIRTLTDDEVKELVEMNSNEAYNVLRAPATARNYLHKMAVQEEEWFKYCFVICVDLSALGSDFLTPDTREPKSEGDIAYDIEFKEVMPANHKLISIFEYKNMLTWNVPGFGISIDT